MNEVLVATAMDAWDAGVLPEAGKLLIEAASGHAAHNPGTLYAARGLRPEAVQIRSRADYEQAPASGFWATVPSDLACFGKDPAGSSRATRLCRTPEACPLASDFQNAPPSLEIYQ